MKHAAIQDDALRGMVEDAYADIRANDSTAAVRKLAEAFLLLLELKPELTGRPISGQPRALVPPALRWPTLGADLQLQSLGTGRKPEIKFSRTRFALSEALTYYECLVDLARGTQV